MGYFIDPHNIRSPNYRPPGERAAEPPPLLTINGLTIPELEQQRQTQARRNTLDDSADQRHAELLDVAKRQQQRIESIHDRSYRDPQLWPVDRVDAAVYGTEPDSDDAKQVAQMKRDIDAVELAADVPVTLAQARVDEISNTLRNTYGDAAQEERNTRARDRVIKRLEKAENHPERVAIVQDALRQARDNAELASLLVELPNELAIAKMEDSLIRQVIDPLLRERLPELAAAQDELAAKQLDAGITRQTAGFVRKSIKSGTPPSDKVLKRLDPQRIRVSRDLGVVIND
jgi:hypothetical protein